MIDMEKLKTPQRVVAIIEHAEFKKLRKISYQTGESMSSIIREAILVRLDKLKENATNG